jgi:hypothetical protein
MYCTLAQKSLGPKVVAEISRALATDQSVPIAILNRKALFPGTSLYRTPHKTRAVVINAATSKSIV